MYKIGIDIGSTSAKTVVLEDGKIKDYFIMPTGWSSVETSNKIKEKLEEDLNIRIEECKIVATGYGRVSVPFANKTLTEITCHGRGAYELFKKDCTVIDIGGQDTKVIEIKDGRVNNFIMNDRCSAGTGRFLEVMTNLMGVTIDELCNIARDGKDTQISSMCTVFAESEVIGLIAKGVSKNDIAFAIIDSITSKVKSLTSKFGGGDPYFLTGGLSKNSYILENLSNKLESKVTTNELSHYAGALGAALLAK